jgi:spore cortex biosynthesis protein YabQ
MLSTSNQAYVFLSTMYAGFIIGFLYDCCRIIRRMIRAGVFVTGILDLLFWSVIGTLSFLVVFYVNDGDVRFFTIVGFVIGWILYVFTLSPFIMKGLTWIYQTLAKIIHWLIKIVLWPFQMLWKAARVPISGIKKLWHKLKSKISSKIHSIFKKSIKKMLKKRNSDLYVE